MKTVNVMGLDLVDARRKDIVEKCRELIDGEGQHYVVTPNPEIILRSYSDQDYFIALEGATLAIPDGIGLKFAALALGKGLKRNTGVALTGDLLKLAEERQYKVVIMNWREGLSKNEDIAGMVHKRYPNLKFVIEDADREWSMPFYQGANLLQPEIMFVNLGSPWQEHFIVENLKKMPYVKIAAGIGGSFDFLTGKVPRAPKTVRVIGMEWLWRLFRQPKRFNRIFNATIKFPLAFIRWRFGRYFLYRKNVACLLFRNTDNGYEVLVANSKRRPGCWQLPQGGTGSEDIESAGIRELTEEVGTNKFKPVKHFDFMHKYGVRKTNRDWSDRFGYRGQKQALLIAEFQGQDSDIKVDNFEFSEHKWVGLDNFVDSVEEPRRESAKSHLKKFKQYLKTNESRNT